MNQPGVAPFAGAWIEIAKMGEKVLIPIVAPFAGAWIEMVVQKRAKLTIVLSLPSRERGLKYR